MTEEYACPNCHKPIYDDDAILCHFCGGSLQRPGSTVLGNMKYGKMQSIWIALAIVLVVAFFIYMII